MLNRTPLRPRLAAGLSLAVLLLGAAAARAELDPELKKPYEVRVVLDVARNRLLTGLFIDQLQRDLRAVVQNCLGDVARVKVVRDHPLLPEIRARGLDKALDGYGRVEDHKTAFVLLDFADGHYQLRARQHDGLTGMSSPFVRYAETTHRLLVAREAARLVRQDFGLVGTVTEASGQTVKLALHGGGLGVPLKDRDDNALVATNSVFAIAQMTREGGRLHSAPMQWAFLQVTGGPDNGVCTCQFYHRFEGESLSGRPDVVGFRCLKLPTVRAHLQLRFIDYKTRQPMTSGVGVRVNANGYSDTGGEGRSTDSAGLTQPTDDTYAHLAYVTVRTGDTPLAQIPVPVLSDRPVDVLFSLDPKAEARGQKELRRELWVRRIYDSLRVAADRVNELNQKIKEKKHDEALYVSKHGLENLKADLQSLGEERDRLEKEGGLDLSEGDQRLEELRRREKELDHFVVRLSRITQEEKDPRRKEMLSELEQARLLMTQADFPKAIEVFEKILEKNPKEEKVRKRLFELRKAFVAQNRKHKNAQDFIYTVWANPKELRSTPELQKGLEEAREAFNVCRSNGDNLAPQKILRADIMRTAQLKDRLAHLHPEAGEDERKEAETIGRLAKELKKLHEDVLDYLEKEKPKFP